MDFEEPMGSRDGAAPERYTEEQLSRVRDALANLECVSAELKEAAWRALPEGLRLEYNYCKWTYEPPLPAGEKARYLTLEDRYLRRAGFPVK